MTLGLLSCLPGCFRPGKWLLSLMFWTWDLGRSLTGPHIRHVCIRWTWFIIAMWLPTHSHITCLEMCFVLCYLQLRFLGSSKCFLSVWKVEAWTLGCCSVHLIKAVFAETHPGRNYAACWCFLEMIHGRGSNQIQPIPRILKIFVNSNDKQWNRITAAGGALSRSDVYWMSV